VFDLERWRQRLPLLDRAMLVQERFGAVGGGPMSSSLGLATFLSLFPLLLVAIAVVGFVSTGNEDFASDLVDSLGISGDGADLVTEAIATAEDSKRTASVIGIVGLVWAGLAVVGALQAVCNGVWQTKGRGILDRAVAVAWLGGAGSLFLLSAALGPLGAMVDGPLTVVPVVAGVALSTGLFVWTYTYLGNQPVSWRAHLPGALIVATAFEVLKQVGVVWLPQMVSRSSALYGTIGIVFATIAWIAIYARVIVYGAVVNVVAWEHEHGTVTVDVEVPRIEGRVPLTADRGGAVAEEATAD
jgi:membrane protein